MKTKLIIVLAIVLGTINLAVGQDKKNEKKARKIAFITERLELTPAESKVFWPLYEQRNKDRKALRTSLKSKKGAKVKIEDMTDAEVVELLDNVLELRQGNLNIQKEYNTKFLAVLPPKKVAKFYHIEKEFKKRSKKVSNEK